MPSMALTGTGTGTGDGVVAFCTRQDASAKIGNDDDGTVGSYFSTLTSFSAVSGVAALLSG
jgi:hypothetical protein